MRPRSRTTRAVTWISSLVVLLAITSPAPAREHNAYRNVRGDSMRCGRSPTWRSMTCQCAHGTAPNVAPCDATTHCCGSAPVVCEHFCGAKKGKWTGKAVVDASPPPDAPSSLDEQPYHAGDDSGDGDDLHQ